MAFITWPAATPRSGFESATFRRLAGSFVIGDCFGDMVDAASFAYRTQKNYQSFAWRARKSRSSFRDSMGSFLILRFYRSGSKFADSKLRQRREQYLGHAVGNGTQGVVPKVNGDSNLMARFNLDHAAGSRGMKGPVCASRVGLGNVAQLDTTTSSV
ncbi:hypothetical protein NL676_020232 [Syzygium grande]|nr:hypothetical protein NL676_020232 [Syzygium grande]